jgi:hypothetical protein
MEGDTMKTFNIYFSDLSEKAQNDLCEFFETTEMDENWDVMPLATVHRESIDEEQDDEQDDEQEGVM